MAAAARPGIPFCFFLSPFFPSPPTSRAHCSVGGSSAHHLSYQYPAQVFLYSSSSFGYSTATPATAIACRLTPLTLFHVGARNQNTSATEIPSYTAPNLFFPFTPNYFVLRNLYSILILPAKTYRHAVSHTHTRARARHTQQSRTRTQPHVQQAHRTKVPASSPASSCLLALSIFSKFQAVRCTHDTSRLLPFQQHYFVPRYFGGDACFRHLPAGLNLALS